MPASYSRIAIPIPLKPAPMIAMLGAPLPFPLPTAGA